MINMDHGVDITVIFWCIIGILLYYYKIINTSTIYQPLPYFPLSVVSAFYHFSAFSAFSAHNEYNGNVKC